MKASKLIDILQQHGQQRQVLVTWEGIFQKIKPTNIYLSPNGRIIIDADDNRYKKGILSGEKKVWSP